MPSIFFFIFTGRNVLPYIRTLSFSIFRQECSEVNLQTISRDDNMDRFLFYRRDAGLSHITFESVRYSGWFISTCEGEEQPVEMCEAEANRRLTSFKIN